MNSKKVSEIDKRRLACKFFDKGFSTKEIITKLDCSRSWLYKWRERFLKGGYSALADLSKAPHHSSHKYQPSEVALVCQTRKRLQGAAVGLVHAGEVQHELRNSKAIFPIPSVSSINRWLKAAGLVHSKKSRQEHIFYPTPQLPPCFVFHSMDWAARFLKGGEKLFAFHTIDFETHAVSQTLACDKTTKTAGTHALQTWNEIGLPDFLQIDNDSAFNAIGLKWGFGGNFLRLCCYLGIEIIFIPPGEAKRNGVIEALNHLWSVSYFARNHLRSVRDAQQQQPKFLSWYEREYHPPSLSGLTVAEAKRKVTRRRLLKKEIAALPAVLPLTTGRVHFIRLVGCDGKIKILAESYKVSKTLANKYVWATIDTAQNSLTIYYRKSNRAKPRVLKSIAYRIEEKVYPLKKQFRRKHRPVDVLQII